MAELFLRALVVLPLLLVSTAISEQTLPDYGTPSFGALSALCLDDGPQCRGTVCDWLNLVAFRGGFASLAATRTFLDERLDTIGAKNWRYLRMPESLMAAIKSNYTDTECKFAPRAMQFRPWRRAIDGVNSPNHVTLVNTSSDGITDGVFIGNVYAQVPGAETYHHHQQISIFVQYGAPPCQIGIDEDGSADTSEEGCNKTVTPETPKLLQVLFTGPQWLHSNWLLPPMAFHNARNCPHKLAPAHYGDRGFMFRIFIPMNDTDVLVPPDPTVHTWKSVAARDKFIAVV